MTGSNTSILDVLTNAVGALLILVILFTKLIGQDATPLTPTAPLAGKREGTVLSPVLFLRYDPSPDLQREMGVTIALDRAGASLWTWDVLSEAPDAAVARLKLGRGIEPFAATVGRSVILTLPVEPGDKVRFSAYPTAGPPTAADTIRLHAFVTGAQLIGPQQLPSVNLRAYRVCWLEPFRSGTVPAADLDSIPVRAYDLDRADLSIEVPTRSETCT